MNARRATTFLLAGILFGPVAAFEANAATSTNTPFRTVSSTHQFVVYANEHLLSSALCVYAERIKHEWLRRMSMLDAWRDPILVIVQPCQPQPNAATVWWQTFTTDKHLKYQVYCCGPPLWDDWSLSAAIVDRLCAEWANRSRLMIRGQSSRLPLMPLWLVQGLTASILERNDTLIGVARRSVAAGRPLHASMLLETKVLPANPAEATLFEANAWMFTESLLTLPHGAEKLQRFLTELGVDKSATAAFWSVYREDFSRDVMLEKWWSLQQFSRVSEIIAQNFSAQETARQLDDILLTKLNAGDGTHGTGQDVQIGFDQLWHYTQSGWLREVLKTKNNRLGTLRGEAHPFYQPAIGQYLEAVTWLLRRNTIRFRRTVAKAAAARDAAQRQMQETTAYLDEAERVYAPEDLSQMLTGYLTTLDRFQNLDQQRRNPISDYLDKFDR